MDEPKVGSAVDQKRYEDARQREVNLLVAQQYLRMEYVAYETQVMQEIARTRQIKGSYPTDLVRATGVLMNESAEAFNEAMAITAKDGTVSSYRGRGKQHSTSALRYELIQTMACALQCLAVVDNMEAELYGHTSGGVLRGMPGEHDR